MVALLVLVPLLLDQSAAQAQLDRIRAEFGQRGKTASVALLAELAEAAPETQAGARALDWLGDIAHLQKEVPLARKYYERAYASPAGGDARRLAARGLGDCDLDEHRWAAATAHFREAIDGAAGVLEVELRNKIGVAEKLRKRGIAENGCWIFFGLALAGFFGRARFWKKPALGVPTELVYVTPLYALMLAGCWGRDAGVFHALWIMALGSIALVGAAGLSSRRVPPLGWRRWLHALVLATANGALFFAACNHAMIVDSLFYTVAPL